MYRFVPHKRASTTYIIFFTRKQRWFRLVFVIYEGRLISISSFDGGELQSKLHNNKSLMPSYPLFRFMYPPRHHLCHPLMCGFLLAVYFVLIIIIIITTTISYMCCMPRANTLSRKSLSFVHLQPSALIFTSSSCWSIVYYLLFVSPNFIHYSHVSKRF